MAHKHVMVIDDDPDIRELLQLVLERAGYHVVTAGDGCEALSSLKHGDPPCLIFLDLMMPGMNGWQFWDALRSDARLEHISVLLLSGAADVNESARRMGVAGALLKPVELRTLVRSVEEFC
jgi:CheY-like chemotaxis protein